MTMNPNLSQQSNERPCPQFHAVDGQMPSIDRTDFDGRTCDCGKISFYSEMCGCSVPRLELKSKPNLDYIPS